MKSALCLIWSLLIFSSIFWYFLLMFYVGAKGGKELVRMTQALRRPSPSPEPKKPPAN
jgi:hypothetical protein